MSTSSLPDKMATEDCKESSPCSSISSSTDYNGENDENMASTVSNKVKSVEHVCTLLNYLKNTFSGCLIVLHENTHACSCSDKDWGSGRYSTGDQPHSVFDTWSKTRSNLEVEWEKQGTIKSRLSRKRANRFWISPKICNATRDGA